MLGQAIGDLLPAAMAVALSPIPIVAVVLVLQGPGAHRKGPAFALGWVGGLTAVSLAAVFLLGGARDSGSATANGVNWGMAAIGVLFLVMAARQWRKRPAPGEQPEMPGWMATIDGASTPKAFVLGVLLSAANPKNLALTLAASAAIAQAGLDGADELLAIAVFVAIGSATVAGAVLFYLVTPRRAQVPLGTVRRFMADNNATIMMVVLLLLGAKIIGDALSGLWT